MSNPRFIIAVMVDEPTRRAAAPAAASPRRPSPALAASALRAANMPPDSTVTDIIIPDNPLEESL